MRPFPGLMGSGEELRIRGIRSESEGVRHRIAADVDGSPLWFESDDAALRPSPEAFVSALLPAAITRRRDLAIEAPLDAVFAANVRGVIDTFAEWWDYPQIQVGAASRPDPPIPASSDAQSGGEVSALCFSGGADSFYSLLSGDETIDALIFVHGFDIRLAEAERADAYSPIVGRIADAVGARAIRIRTNLRDHPAFRRVPWGRAHGGAMAAMGHAIAGVSRLLVAASFPKAYPYPWGSRWDLDGLWSSACTQIVHHGADRWRAEKLRELSHQPLAQAHLRVCWEHRSKALNCSRCEKCVRTMLVLAQCGALDRFSTFETGVSLANRVSGLGEIPTMLRPIFEALLVPEIDPQVSDSIRSLLARSRRRERRRALKRAWKRFRHVAFP